MELTALRVQDARQLIARVEATDITNPDLPTLTAVDLISRMRVVLETLAGHAEAQEASISRLQEDKRQLNEEVQRLKYELADQSDEVTVAA